MATNLAIDDRLLQKAVQAGGLRTKKETVTKALEEFIQRRQQRKILRASGTFEFREGWDYKADRHGRPLLPVCDPHPASLSLMRK